MDDVQACSQGSYPAVWCPIVSILLYISSWDSRFHVFFSTQKRFSFVVQFLRRALSFPEYVSHQEVLENEKAPSGGSLWHHKPEDDELTFHMLKGAGWPTCYFYSLRGPWCICYPLHFWPHLVLSFFPNFFFTPLAPSSPPLSSLPSSHPVFCLLRLSFLY